MECKCLEVQEALAEPEPAVLVEQALEWAVLVEQALEWAEQAVWEACPQAWE